MQTPEFLEWLADRLVNVYGENPNVDFILSLRERAKHIAALQARVAELEAALVELADSSEQHIQWLDAGGHTDACSTPTMIGESGNGLEDCDCGLADDVRRYEEAFSKAKIIAANGGKG